jgi:hypothetical protein
MKKSTILCFLAIVGSASQAQAANLAVITSPPTFLCAFALLVACAGLAFCLQVLSLVKGGLFSRIWQVFVLGFVLLALSQTAVLLGNFEILTLPAYVVPALMLLMAGLFTYGIMEAKRILS